MKHSFFFIAMFCYCSFISAQTLYSTTTAEKLKTINPSEIKSGLVQLNGFAVLNDGGGGLFYWDSSSFENETRGMVIKAAAIERGRWLRTINDNTVYAQWFGIKADGKTDDSKALQNSIDYCLTHKAMHLVLPQGAILVSQTIHIGSAAKTNAEETSFLISGQGISTTVTSFSGGTSIVYNGAKGAGTSIINIETSAARYLSFERFNVAAAELDGVETGLNFVSSDESFFRFTEIKFVNASTCVKQNVGTGGNGEFTLYEHCRFEQFSKDGYYHDAPQALSVKFFYCMFTPREGATVWDFVNASGGQFIGNDISFFRTGSGNMSTVFKVGGPQSDPLIVEGGRWEGTDQLVYFYPGTNRLPISFEGIMIGVNLRTQPFTAVDFSDAPDSYLEKVMLHNCTINISTGNVVQQAWGILVGNAKNAYFKAEDCLFQNTQPGLQANTASKPILMNKLPQNNSSKVEFLNCITTFNTPAPAMRNKRMSSVLIDGSKP